MPSFTQFDLAWMAGVIDLKGRLTYKNNRTRATRQITLTVDSKEHLVVRRLCAMTGTKPEFRKTSPLSPELLRRNCTEHCPEPHVHVDNEWTYGSIRWTATGASMVAVLGEIEPYITVDRGYQEAIDEVMASVSLEGRGSIAVVGGLIRLYELGWTIRQPFLRAVEQRLVNGSPDSSMDRAASS
jgi:hypothetical protein